jgi:hypothetical protein
VNGYKGTIVRRRAALLVVLLEEVHDDAARKRAPHRPLAYLSLGPHVTKADAEQVALVELSPGEPGQRNYAIVRMLALSNCCCCCCCCWMWWCWWCCCCTAV